MNTVVRIDGVDYAAADRALHCFDALDQLDIVLDGGYGQLCWTISGVRPMPLFADGMTVELRTDGTLRFVGNIESIQHHQVDVGWAITFRALDLKHRADFATVFGQDGSAEAVYNRPPSGDNLYVSSDAGLSVGTIVQRVLTIAYNASVLSGYGVGAYIAPSPSPWTLPAITVSELAALTVVPPRVVSLSGDGLFNVLCQFVQTWHPRYTLWLQPDGTIRCTNLFTLTAHALVVPGEHGACDPVTWPQLTRDTSGCFTQVQMSGVSARGAILSIVDGTLERAWSSMDETNWKLSDFTQPKDATDTGTLSSVTTSTCVVTSDFPAAHWPTNFWDQSTRLGWITFIYPGGTGIDIHDSRKITSCTALTAGGTSTITWDASDPLDALTYTRYRIVGTSGPLLDVGRRFNVREPVGPHLGLATYVGSHLLPRFPQPMPWANNGKLLMTSTPVGVVMWSPSGAGPWFEFPIIFEVVPSAGQILASQPVVAAFSSPGTLAKGYPTTYANGKPYDVKVFVPYNRGLLTSVAPGVGAYSGTAYTQDGIRRIRYVPLDAWNYQGDSANVATLAAELLAVCQDAVIEGSITYHGIPGGFDSLAMPYALTLSIASATSPWDGLNLPVRSVSLRWPQGGGTLHTVTFNVSNKKRPFQGWDLYLHPIANRELEDLSGHRRPFDDANVGQVHEVGFTSMGGAGLNPGVDSGEGMGLGLGNFMGATGLGGPRAGAGRAAAGGGGEDDGFPKIPGWKKPATPGTGLVGASIPFDPMFGVAQADRPPGMEKQTPVPPVPSGAAISSEATASKEFLASMAPPDPGPDTGGGP